MVLHMSRRLTRVRFLWETTPVGWLQTWSSPGCMHFDGGKADEKSRENVVG